MRWWLGIFISIFLSIQGAIGYELSLAEKGTYAFDKSHNLSISDVLANDDLDWIPIQDELSLGLRHLTIWVRLPIPSIEKQDENQSVFILTNQLINSARVYLVNDKQLITGTHLGDHVAISKKSVKVSDIYWLLPIGWEQATHFYLQIKTDSFLQSHFKIKSVAQTIEDHGTRYGLLGLFYGALFIMFFYNLFVFFQVSDLRYIYYTGYVLTVALFHASMDGLPYYFLSEFTQYHWDRLSIYFVNCANIFALLFVKSFLDIKEPQLLRAIFILISTFVVALLIEVINGQHISTVYSTVMTVVTSFSIAYITISTWLRGNPQARYLALAWIVLLVSVPVFVLTLNGIIPHNVYTLNSVRIGVILELALISFSLTHRINILRQERLGLQRRLNKELGTMVTERTKELESANKKLQELSETDALTQIKNRAYFNASMDEETARAHRNGSHLSLLIADLDHFKKINDNLGHNAGDYCLKHFATLFKEQLTRVTDLACRYGGEEFIALLPETELNGALEVAERIRKALDDSTVVFEGTPIALTVSIGVFSSTANNITNTNDWVAKADKALYFAKTQRNSVAFNNEQGEPAFYEPN